MASKELTEEKSKNSNPKRKKHRWFGFFIALLLLCFGIFIYDNLFVESYPVSFSDSVKEYSSKYGVPQEIVYAVIKTESDFDASAKSSKGTIGLMQLLPSTAEDIASRLGITDYDLENPKTNIEFGSYYLSYLYASFGDWQTVFAAYNAGLGNVREWLNDSKYSSDGITLDLIPFSETKTYVRKINRAVDKYRNKLGI